MSNLGPCGNCGFNLDIYGECGCDNESTNSAAYLDENENDDDRDDDGDF